MTARSYTSAPRRSLHGFRSSTSGEASAPASFGRTAEARRDRARAHARAAPDPPRRADDGARPEGAPPDVRAHVATLNGEGRTVLARRAERTGRASRSPHRRGARRRPRRADRRGPAAPRRPARRAAVPRRRAGLSRRARVPRRGRRDADHPRQPHRPRVRRCRSSTARSAPPTSPDQRRGRRLRADVVRPGLPEHRVVPQRDHLHRRRRGHPALPRLPDRAARRAGELPRDGLPAARGRAADRRRSSRAWEDDVRDHTYVHTNVTKFLEGFRYDAHPMGMLLGAVGALSTFYPDAKNIADPENRYLQRVRLIAKMPTIAAFIFRHSRGLPYVLPAQRPRLHRQLRQHDVRDRRPARAEPGAAAGARDPAHPPRRPRAELLDERGARRRLLARRPVLGRLGRASPRSTARCTAAPTRRCCGCSTRSATQERSRRSSRA